MKKIFTIFSFSMLLLLTTSSSSFALPDAEVQQLTKESSLFNSAEKRILDVWANLPKDLKKEVQKAQIEWIKVTRDQEAEVLMKSNGKTKAEAYTIVTNTRSDYLENLKMNYNSRVHVEYVCGIEVLKNDNGDIVWPDKHEGTICVERTKATDVEANKSFASIDQNKNRISYINEVVDLDLQHVTTSEPLSKLSSSMRIATKKDIEDLKRLATSGNYVAQYYLAENIYNYLDEQGSSENYLKWLKSSAEQNYYPAISSLVLAYGFASISSRDERVSEEFARNAFKWAVKGVEVAENDEDKADAHLELGDKYRDGDGTTKDIDKAKKHYLLANELGHEKATERLSELNK
jgi:hypothetical protein